MRFKTVGNKVDKAFIVIANPSSTVTIPMGAPSYFTMVATGRLGVDVQNAASATGVMQNFFAGIVSDSQQYGAGNSGLGPGFYGEAQVWGFVQSLRLIAQTRASSSASFSTSSGSMGDLLQPLTNTIAVTQVTGSATTLTAASTLSYDAFSDVGSAPTVISGSYASAPATTASNTVNISGAFLVGQFAVLAQTFTASALASSAINTLGGGTYGSSLSAGSSILYSTIAVNAFLAYL